MIGIYQSPYELIAARAVQGFGASILAPNVLAIISITFPEGSERTRALARCSVVAGARASLGLVDEKAGPAGGRIENGAWIEASLSNGQWLLVVFKLDPPPPSDPVAAQFSLVSIGAWVITALGLAALLSLLAARWVVKPLSELSGALDRLGPGGDDPSVPPHGPREIEGIIKAFNRMRKRLRRFNEDRTHMMAAMSHNLRTPLTRLRMRIEMAEGWRISRRCSTKSI